MQGFFGAASIQTCSLFPESLLGVLSGETLGSSVREHIGARGLGFRVSGFRAWGFKVQGLGFWQGTAI